MLELIKSQKFQEEYQGYQARIEKIASGNVKNQATALLKSLVNEVKSLDAQHQEMFTSNQVPMRLDEIRNGIGGIRKKLDTLLKDWERHIPNV